MKIVFLGTPEFALPSLSALIESGHEVTAVITQPDKKRDRGGKMQPPPVKVFAESKNIPVFQFQKLRKEGVDTLKTLMPDLMVTAAYGQILSREILDIPKYGVLNVHGSLLPKYRGAAPVQWALINGEKETGVTIMQTAEGLDTGDMLLKAATEITEEDNFDSLYTRLSETGAKLLVEAISLIESGKAVFTPQMESEASHYPMIQKADGELHFHKSARELFNLIRAIPCYTYLNGTLLKVLSSNVIEEDVIHDNAGEVIIASFKHGIVVSCGKGSLRLTNLQPESGKPMTDTAYLNGRKLSIGTKLGQQ